MKKTLRLSIVLALLFGNTSCIFHEGHHGRRPYRTGITASYGYAAPAPVPVPVYGPRCR